VARASPFTPDSWAHDARDSFLLGAQATREAVEAAGLRELRFGDGSHHGRQQASRHETSANPSHWRSGRRATPLRTCIHLYNMKSLTSRNYNDAMAILTVRNLPDDVHRALRVRAAQHGRSTEAEIRDILEKAAKPEGRLKLGSLLVSIAREAGGLNDAEVERFNQLRDKTPPEPLSFE
jgi:plasmid stability protein